MSCLFSPHVSRHVVSTKNEDNDVAHVAAQTSSTETERGRNGREASESKTYRLCCKCGEERTRHASFKRANKENHGIQGSDAVAQHRDVPKRKTMEPSLVQGFHTTLAIPTKVFQATGTQTNQGVLLGEQKRRRFQVLERHRKRSEGCCQRHRAKSRRIHPTTSSTL